MEVNCIATYRNVGGVFDIVVGNHNLEFEPRHATLSDSPYPEHRIAITKSLKELQLSFCAVKLG